MHDRRAMPRFRQKHFAIIIVVIATGFLWYLLISGLAYIL